MANYDTFDELFSDITNATCIRNNKALKMGSKDTIPFSDFDFYYDNNKVTNFYAFGCGAIGIGQTATNKALRLFYSEYGGTAYIYTESATVREKKVFRIKFISSIYYYYYDYSTTSQYTFIYDAAFVENGDIVVKVSKKPNACLTAPYNGLWISSQIVSSDMTNEEIPIIKTFIPSDPSTGTAFTLSNKYPRLSDQYCLIQSQNKLYTITNNILTEVNDSLSELTFVTYGICNQLPNYNLYSSLTNPEILIYDDDDIDNVSLNLTYKTDASVNPGFSQNAIITTKTNPCMQDTFKYSSYTAFSQNFKKIFVSGSGDLKILFITTQSYTYDSHTYSPNSYSFKDGNWIITNDLEHDGMSVSEFNAIPKNKWLEVFPNEFYLKVYIPLQDSYFENVVVIYNGFIRCEDGTKLRTVLSPFKTEAKLPINLSACFENISIGGNFYNGFHDFSNLTSVFYDINKEWEISTNSSVDYAFSGCRNLINFPTYVRGNTLANTFYGCKQMTTAPILVGGMRTLNNTFCNCTNLVNVPIIPNTVTDMIGTFMNCTNLVNAPTIPNSVINMGTGFAGAFANCTNLVNAPIIPNSVKNMWDTFHGCTNLINVPTIPNAVTTLRSTFFGCSKLTSIPTLPNTVKDVSHTFDSCTNLTVAPTLPESVTSCTGTFAFCYNIDKRVVPNAANIHTLEDWYAGWDKLTSPPTIPSHVTNLYGTFYACRYLTSPPTIPNGVTTMCETFEYCKKLTTPPTIPSSVTNLTATFRGSGITSMPTIPNGVVSMKETFDSCANLVTPKNIPESVNDLSSAFEYANKISGNIYIHANNAKIDSWTFYKWDNSFPVLNVYVHSGTNTYNNVYKALGNTTTNPRSNIALKTF